MVKPLAGRQIHWGHPLSMGLASAIVMDGHSGAWDLVLGKPWRSSPGNSVQAPSFRSKFGGGLSTTTPGNTGRMLYLPDFDQSCNITDSCTVVLHKRKLDTTARAAYTFANTATAFTVGPGNNAFDAIIDYTDTATYWDFGGASGANRISATGITYGDDVWVFTAGKRGSAMYQNGRLLTSQSTPITRLAGSAPQLCLNCSTDALPTQDVAEHDFMYIYRRELSQFEAQLLSADPYCFIGTGQQRSVLLGAGSPSSATSGYRRRMW